MRNTTISISPRQRITITAVYLLSIYSTLGIARSVTEFLRTVGILLPTVVFFFAGSAPFVLFWRYAILRRRQLILRIILIVLLLCSAFLIAGTPEERLHFLIYGLLGWLFCWCLEPNSVYVADASSKNKIIRYLLPCLLVWLAGGIDELIQWRLPSRVFDVRDILFNGVAGMMGIALFSTGRSDSGKICSQNQKASIKTLTGSTTD